MASICGADCKNCGARETCPGCAETCGQPFGGRCITAESYRNGGEENYFRQKQKILAEFNGLGIPDMPQIPDLCPLNGFYVNLEYPLPSGETIKLLKDSDIYLGYQVEKSGSDRCFGLVANDEFLLVSEYGPNGTAPQIVLYKKR